MHKLILVVLAAFVSILSFGQTGTNSPFSTYGLGEVGGLDHAAFIGIGNSTITMNDSTILNYYNPASYNSLAKHKPLFSFGVASRYSIYSENGKESSNTLTSIQHMAMAFPFAKRFGLGVGIKPYSSRGYDFSTRTKVNDDSLHYVYSGSGGLNEFFGGLSIKALEFKGAKLSLGANFGYIFGQVTNTRKSGLIDANTESNNYAGGINSKLIQAKAFHYTLGATYSQKIKEKHEINVSAVFDPFQKINTEYQNVLFYSSNVNNPNVYDTLAVFDTLTGNLSTVPTITYGLNYVYNFTGRKKHTNPLNSQLSFHATYASAQWSRYENTFDPTFTNTFLNSTKLTFGLQYLPETNFIANKSLTKFHHRVKYRIGVYQQLLPYETNNEQVKDFGTTFGFGIPVIVKNSLSSINFGFSVGKRGVSDANALNEQYYGFNVGISIAPGADKWFVKRKLN